MVAQAGIDRSFDEAELFLVTALPDRPQRPVDDVTGYEHEVGMLGVDHIHPAGNLGLAVMVSGVEVAGKDYGKWPVQGFLSPDVDRLADVLDMDLSALMSTLMLLELDDYVRSLFGKKYFPA